MNRISKTKKRGDRIRKDKNTCPQCKEVFINRRERRIHQKLYHKKS